MKKLIYFSFIFFIIAFGFTYFTDNALASTRWAGVGQRGGSETIGQAGIQEVPEGYALTGVGLGGGGYSDCALYIRTAPVINGVVNFDYVSDWTWSIDMGGYAQDPYDPEGPPIYVPDIQRSPGTCSGARQPSPRKFRDYQPGYVITGWNWEIDYGVVGEFNIGYYQEYAPLDDINNRTNTYTRIKNGSIDENVGKNLDGSVSPRAIVRAPQNRVIVGIGFDLWGRNNKPGPTGITVTRAKVFPAPIAVKEKVTWDGRNYVYSEIPATQSSPFETQTDKSIRLMVSKLTGDWAQNGSYTWLTQDDGAYDPQYETAINPNVSYLGSSGGMYFNIAFNTPGLKVVTVTSVDGSNGSAYINIPVPPPPIDQPTCRLISPDEDEVGIGTETTFRASGGDGSYNWSADGTVNPSNETANITFPSDGLRTVTITSAGLSGNCFVTVNPAPPPPPEPTKPKCSITPFRSETGDIIAIQATGGDGENYDWDFLVGSGTITPTSGSPVSATFSESGVKIVTVTSAGLKGACITLVSAPVEPTKPTCVVSPFISTVGDSVTITASGGDGTNYNWGFLVGSGTITPTSGNPVSATFSGPGAKLITVESADDKGLCVAIVSEVAPPPEPEFEDPTCQLISPGEDEVGIGTETTFRASGGDGSYNWSADGTVNPSPPNSANITFPSDGLKTVTVTSAGLSGDCSVTVLPPPPTVNISGPGEVSFPFDASDPAEVTYTINWNSSNAISCFASGDWSGVKPTSGSELFTKSQRGTYTYRIACSNSSGSDSDSVSVKVSEIPRCIFSANPESIVPPQVSTLEWTCRYANSCSINNNIGSVSNTEGSNVVRPTETTIYTLSCSGADGSSSFSTTVFIDFIPWLREIIPIWK